MYANFHLIQLEIDLLVDHNYQGPFRPSTQGGMSLKNRNAYFQQIVASLETYHVIDRFLFLPHFRLQVL
jgi:hypothetical protein